jgi:S-methyl-5-thioribose-1-phosphate isomerase
MRVKVGGKTLQMWTLWREDGVVKIIDQRLLPHRFEVATLKNYRETAQAIRDMALRGAGAIGVAGGYGMAQAALEAERLPPRSFRARMVKAAEVLKATRPTAVGLFHAVDRCLALASKGRVERRIERIVDEADNIALEDLAASQAIGEHGSKLIKDGYRILTHCNAGALAFIDYGTAVSPIRFAVKQGKSVFVYVDETRPRSQGAKLTAWELEQEGIPYALIVDNAAGHYMRRREIDMVIVGADRIAANGDAANKIGTYEKAVLAHENGIPFYVAAPMMTFDPDCRTGDDIAIEERSPDEVNWVWGEDEEGELTRVRISARDTPARNPSFDVTPAKYIKGIITEAGVLAPPYGRSIRKALSGKRRGSHG